MRKEKKQKRSIFLKLMLLVCMTAGALAGGWAMLDQGVIIEALQAADDEDATSNVAFSGLASAAASAYDTALDEAKSGDTTNDMATTLNSKLATAGNAGGVAGYLNKDTHDFFGWGMTNVSQSSESMSYSADSGLQISYGLRSYLMYGQIWNEMGMDAMQTRNNALGDMGRGIGGGLLWIAYLSNSTVSWIFSNILSFIQFINPFRFLYNSGITGAGIIEQELNNAGVMGDQGGMANFAAFHAEILGIFKALQDLSWGVVVPFLLLGIALGFTIFSGDPRKSRRTLWRNLAKIAFIGLGVPLMGALYTASIQAMHEAVENDTIAGSFVITSTFVDFEKWAGNTNLAYPKGVISGTADAGGEGGVESIQYKPPRMVARAINELTGAYDGIATSDKDASDNEAEFSQNMFGHIGNQTVNVNDNILDLLGRYMRSSLYHASDYETYVKSQLLNTKEDVQKLKDLTDAESFIDTLNDDQLQQLLTDGKLTATFRTMPGTGELRVSYKQDDPERTKGLSTLAMYNYLTTDFDETGATVHSVDKSVATGVIPVHYSVNMIGSGFSQIIYFLNAMVMLAFLTVIGWAYAIGLLTGVFSRTWRILQTIAGSMLGLFPMILKMIATVLMAIIEILMTIFGYLLVANLMVAVTEVFEGLLDGSISAVPGAVIFGGKVLAAGPSLSSLTGDMFFAVVNILALSFLTFRAIKLRPQMIRAMDEMFTKSIDRILSPAPSSATTVSNITAANNSASVSYGSPASGAPTGAGAAASGMTAGGLSGNSGYGYPGVMQDPAQAMMAGLLAGVGAKGAAAAGQMTDGHSAGKSGSPDIAHGVMHVTGQGLSVSAGGSGVQGIEAQDHGGGKEIERMLNPVAVGNGVLDGDDYVLPATLKGDRKAQSMVLAADAQAAAARDGATPLEAKALDMANIHAGNGSSMQTADEAATPMARRMSAGQMEEGILQGHDARMDMDTPMVSSRDICNVQAGSRNVASDILQGHDALMDMDIPAGTSRDMRNVQAGSRNVASGMVHGQDMTVADPAAALSTRSVADLRTASIQQGMTEERPGMAGSVKNRQQTVDAAGLAAGQSGYRQLADKTGNTVSGIDRADKKQPVNGAAGLAAGQSGYRQLADKAGNTASGIDRADKKQPVNGAAGLAAGMVASKNILAIEDGMTSKGVDMTVADPAAALSTRSVADLRTASIQQGMTEERPGMAGSVKNRQQTVDAAGLAAGQSGYRQLADKTGNTVSGIDRADKKQLANGAAGLAAGMVASKNILATEDGMTSKGVDMTALKQGGRKAADQKAIDAAKGVMTGTRPDAFGKADQGSVDLKAASVQIHGAKDVKMPAASLVTEQSGAASLRTKDQEVRDGRQAGNAAGKDRGTNDQMANGLQAKTVNIKGAENVKVASANAMTGLQVSADQDRAAGQPGKVRKEAAGQGQDLKAMSLKTAAQRSGQDARAGRLQAQTGTQLDGSAYGSRHPLDALQKRQKGLDDGLSAAGLVKGALIRPDGTVKDGIRHLKADARATEDLRTGSRKVQSGPGKGRSENDGLQVAGFMSKGRKNTADMQKGDVLSSLDTRSVSLAKAKNEAPVIAAVPGTTSFGGYGKPWHQDVNVTQKKTEKKKKVEKKKKKTTKKITKTKDTVLMDPLLRDKTSTSVKKYGEFAAKPVQKKAGCDTIVLDKTVNKRKG